MSGWVHAASPGTRPPFPTLTSPVVDEAGLLPPDAAARLAARLAAYASANHGKELVVVTLPTLNGYPIEDYGYQLGRYWGIGKKGLNNGALLIIDAGEHRMRIEVGYGLEGRLTDAASIGIIHNIIAPKFRQGDYVGGINAGVRAILHVMGGKIPPVGARSASPRHNPYSGLLMLLAVYFFIALLRSPRGPGSGLLPLLLGMGLGGGVGGGGGGGGGSDDDFSGGGGSFGGGGASGGW